MKPRRDITLGEMQDECKRVFGGCALCRVRKECVYNTLIQLRELDLSDPPRFTEAQMAFWRGWYAMGARKAVCASGFGAVNLFDGKDAFALSGFTTSGFDSGLKNGEILDLAELLGKDGAE